jgi:hypothetical protein
MAGDEHGALLGCQPAQEAPQPGDAFRVEAVGGFVEDQDSRIAAA